MGVNAGEEDQLAGAQQVIQGIQEVCDQNLSLRHDNNIQIYQNSLLFQTRSQQRMARRQLEEATLTTLRNMFNDLRVSRGSSGINARERGIGNDEMQAESATTSDSMPGLETASSFSPLFSPILFQSTTPSRPPTV
uniref:Uncharacterized protein n=1 Tax=Psilocybe cubensis TaxID=181762 RepID=A0A8H7Y037_PSICU